MLQESIWENGGGKMGTKVQEGHKVLSNNDNDVNMLSLENKQICQRLKILVDL